MGRETRGRGQGQGGQLKSEADAHSLHAKHLPDWDGATFAHTRALGGNVKEMTGYFTFYLSESPILDSFYFLLVESERRRKDCRPSKSSSRRNGREWRLVSQHYLMKLELSIRADMDCSNIYKPTYKILYIKLDNLLSASAINLQ